VGYGTTIVEKGCYEENKTVGSEVNNTPTTASTGEQVQNTRNHQRKRGQEGQLIGKVRPRRTTVFLKDRSVQDEGEEKLGGKKTWWA